MPGYKVHLAAGLVLATLSSMLISEHGLHLAGTRLAMFVLFAMVGSLAPDLDHHKSKAHRLLGKAALVIIPISMILLLKGVYTMDALWLLGAVLFLLSIPLIFKHRGLWHFPLGLLLAIPLYLYLGSYGLPSAAGYLLGYISHLILDLI